jgi:hypothetical protein
MSRVPDGAGHHPTVDPETGTADACAPATDAGDHVGPDRRLDEPDRASRPDDRPVGLELVPGVDLDARTADAGQTAVAAGGSTEFLPDRSRGRQRGRLQRGA